MPLSEKSRNCLYTYFSSTELDEEAVSEMLSYFPARDLEEPVTKDFLQTELAALRLEMRAELHEEIGGLRRELREEIGGLRAELRTEMRQQFFWLLSTQLVVLGVLSSLIVALH